MDTYKINNQGITALCDRAEKYLISNGANKSDVTRNRLTMEETLLKFKSAFGDSTVVEYREAKLFRQLRIILTINGCELNPFEIKKDEEDFLMDSLLQSYDVDRPNWRYHNLSNQVVFNIAKQGKLGILQKLLIAILAGSILGFVARLIPGEFGYNLATDYVAPLANAFVGLMCVMAVFLTFFAVSLAIVHAGDMTTLSNIGKTMLGRIAKIMLLVTSAITLLMIPMMSFGGDAGSVRIKSAYDLIIGFIPANPISPLVEFNTAQIIIVGALFGFTMLMLGSKTHTLESVFTECNLVAINCNSAISRSAIHIYVGLNFFTLVATASDTSFMQSLKIIVIVLTSYLALMLIYTIIATRILEVDCKKLVKRLMPAFMINISSANYGSSFTTSIETLFDCGTDIDYGALGHNVGGFLFKPSYAILLVVGTVVSATENGLTFNIGYIVTIILLAIILSMSLPTIPGATISGFTLMFAQLGLSAESLAIVVTLNAMLDFFTVAVNGYCLQSEILISAKKAGRIDTSKI